MLFCFESYSEHQRREDFIEIVNCKKEYLENLIKDLENRLGVQDGVDGGRTQGSFADLSII